MCCNIQVLNAQATVPGFYLYIIPNILSQLIQGNTQQHFMFHTVLMYTDVLMEINDKLSKILITSMSIMS